MKSKEMQKILHGYGDDLDVGFFIPGTGSTAVPTGHSRLNDTILFNSCRVLKGYTVHKDFIKGDSLEVRAMPVSSDMVIKSKQQAAVIITTNIFDEIGWSMPDIRGKFITIFRTIEETGPCNKYSFANCLWWIEEVY